MKTYSIFSKMFALICAVAIIGVVGCKPELPEVADIPDPNRSGATEVLSLDLDLTNFEHYTEGDQITTTIDTEHGTVVALVPWYVGSMLLAPTVGVTPGATVAPASGSMQDFSEEVIYTVRAQNGTKRAWRVTILQDQSEPNRDDDGDPRRLETNHPAYPMIRFSAWGNAYATGTNVSRSGNVSTGYITNTNNGTFEDRYHTIYFIARTPGELQMALRGSTGAAGGSTAGNQINVRAFINGEMAHLDGANYNYTYTYTGGTNDTLILNRLIIPAIPEGHAGVQVKLEIRGVGTRNGTWYYRFFDVLLSGWATRGTNGSLFNDKPTGINFSYATARGGMEQPSIHLNANAPAGNMEYFYVEVTVPEGYDPTGHYFMTQGNTLGYAGIQTNSANERRFLFSIWSPINETNDNRPYYAYYNPKLVRVNNDPDFRPGITYTTFAGEGVGGQSRRNVMWEAGKTYKFLTRIRPHPDQVRFPNSSLIKAWFHDGNKWNFMCEWRRPELDADAPASHGTKRGPSWYQGASHFLEDWGGNLGRVTAMAHYDNHWFITDQGEYVEPVSFRFTGDQANGKYDVAGGVVEGTNSMFLKTGGYFTELYDFPNPIHRPYPAVRPDLDLVALNAMGTDDPREDGAITWGERYNTGELPDPTGIAFDNEQLSLNLLDAESRNVSSRIVITPAGSFQPDLVWTSNRPDVVSVDSVGTVKALGSGAAIVRARIAGTNLEAALFVNVISEYVPVESISVADGSLILSGDPVLTTSLNVTFSPSNATNQDILSWSSSDESIATVDQNGVVTAVPGGGPGTVTITATAADRGRTGTGTVTVLPVGFSQGWWYTIYQRNNATDEYPDFTGGGGNYARYFRWISHTELATTHSYNGPAGPSNVNLNWNMNNNTTYIIRVLPETGVDGVYQCDVFLRPNATTLVPATDNMSTFDAKTGEFSLIFVPRTANGGYVIGTSWAADGVRRVGEQAFNKRLTQNP